ncbi:tetratricopeptide repeat protein [Limnoraphis robusta Tam1]|uniref:Tetratricopeptide repeat protein n=1 Tax=Limnoraphis robusta CCNP1315 TaxID=3110306 RepID=A0ABU5U156_9CYAN|nr:tetratricopeptide repeat protein [Limnoraphis robusta]MEA5520398.1 tetratricopeptide repeat protein [Limnoraphis robusta CCNP1315]MEA5542495.1 tetratricopeptide repeat protein [Limnoraphis robusta Tam1]MEA5548197.1 tetratricopeptide repeat protein [Limnoraphis robusta CCNP1324]
MTSSLYHQALEQLQAGDLAGALQSLDQALNEHPEFADALYQRGKLRVKLGDLQGALADYTEVLRLQPTIEAFLKRGLIYLMMDAAPAAIIDAQQATRLAPRFAAAYQLLGKAYRQVGNTEQAITAYKQAVRCYIEQQDKSAAQSCLQQIESLFVIEQATAPKAQSVIFTAPQDFIQQATVKTEQGNFSEALADLDWLLDIDPNCAEALCQRAIVQAKLGNTQAAVENIARAIKVQPENREIRIQRGIIRLSLGDIDGAITDFTNLIAQESNNANLFQQRGNCYRQLGDWENAFKDYSNALGIDCEHPEILAARAEVQQAISEFEGAQADYKRAAELYFNDGNWAAHQRIVTQLKSLQETLKRHKEASIAAQKQIVRVPIKHYAWKSPVIEANFNNQQRFDVVLDTGASITVITQRIAQSLGIKPVGLIRFRSINGSLIQAPAGWVESLSVGKAIAICLQVAIADNSFSYPRLGQDFLRNYNTLILSDEIEFQYRPLT